MPHQILRVNRTNRCHVVKLTSGSLVPHRATPDATGFDLFANTLTTLRPNQLTQVSTGVIVVLPLGLSGEIKGRSGLTMQGIEVKLGVIDGVNNSEKNK